MNQWVKNPPAMQETREMQVQPMGREDPLEECLGTQSSILASRIPGKRLAVYSPKGLKELDRTERLRTP